MIAQAFQNIVGGTACLTVVHFVGISGYHNWATTTGQAIGIAELAMFGIVGIILIAKAISLTWRGAGRK